MDNENIWVVTFVVLMVFTLIVIGGIAVVIASLSAS